MQKRNHDTYHYDDKKKNQLRSVHRNRKNSKRFPIKNQEGTQTPEFKQKNQPNVRNDHVITNLYKAEHSNHSINKRKCQRNQTNANLENVFTITRENKLVKYKEKQLLPADLKSTEEGSKKKCKDGENKEKQQIKSQQFLIEQTNCLELEQSKNQNQKQQRVLLQISKHSYFLSINSFEQCVSDIENVFNCIRACPKAPNLNHLYIQSLKIIIFSNIIEKTKEIGNNDAETQDRVQKFQDELTKTISMYNQIKIDKFLSTR